MPARLVPVNGKLNSSSNCMWFLGCGMKDVGSGLWDVLDALAVVIAVRGTGTLGTTTG